MTCANNSNETTFVYWCPYIRLTDDICGGAVFDQLDTFRLQSLTAGEIQTHTTTITPSAGWTTAELDVTLQLDSRDLSEYTYVPESDEVCEFHTTITR